MTDTEILTAILAEIRLMREEAKKDARPHMTTKEALEYLGYKDQMLLTLWHREGYLPNRHGSNKSGYKYLKSEVLALKTMLFTGEVKVPSRRKMYQTGKEVVSII